MKTTKFFFMAALALTFVACSNEDLTKQPVEQPAKADGIPFTATISVGESGTMRALTENGTKLEATWAVDEEVALIHNGVKDVMTVESVSGGAATISGTITGSPTDGDPVTIIYPATAADGTTGNVKSDLLYSQEGTLAAVASKYDVRKGTGNLKVVSETASLDGNVSLTNQFAIWKLTLNHSAKYLYITAKISVSHSCALIAGAIRATAGTEFYVAVPAVSSPFISVVATDGTDCWYYTKRPASPLSAGNYYQSAPTMTEVGTSDHELVYKKTTPGTTLGCTVILSGVNFSSDYAYIAFPYGGTLILVGNNTITAGEYVSAGVQDADGSSLYITGPGSLTVTCTSSIYNAPGIGMRDNTTGDILICGGTINATGSGNAPGIGWCGIGSHGNITITNGVTQVTATKGSGALHSIGKGSSETSCGTITIGGTIYWDGTDYVGTGSTYLTQNSITYTP